MRVIVPPVDNLWSTAADWMQSNKFLTKQWQDYALAAGYDPLAQMLIVAERVVQGQHGGGNSAGLFIGGYDYDMIEGVAAGLPQYYQDTPFLSQFADARNFTFRNMAKDIDSFFGRQSLDIYNASEYELALQFKNVDPRAKLIVFLTDAERLRMKPMPDKNARNGTLLGIERLHGISHCPYSFFFLSQMRSFEVRNIIDGDVSIEDDRFICQLAGVNTSRYSHLDRQLTDELHRR